MTAVPSPRISIGWSSGDPLGVVGIVLGDVGGEVDLGLRCRERLAHLADDDRGELVAPLPMQLCCSADERRALGDGGVAPGAVGGIRLLENGLERFVGDRRIGGEGLAGRGVDDGVVGHVRSVLSGSRVCVSWRRDVRSPARRRSSTTWRNKSLADCNKFYAKSWLSDLVEPP